MCLEVSLRAHRENPDKGAWKLTGDRADYLARSVAGGYALFNYDSIAASCLTPGAPSER